MRILLVGHSLLSPWTGYTHRALKRLGHSVRRVYCTSLLLDRLTLAGEKDLAVRESGSGKNLRALREGWHRWRDRRLIAAARSFRPELILVLWGNTLSPELLHSLKKKSGARMATWWVDDPFRHRAEKLIPLYDFFFIFDRSYMPALQKQGARNVRFLPCACDEAVYHPKKLTPGQLRRYRSEVALVAWYCDTRLEIVNALSRFDLRIWGRGWRRPEVLKTLNGNHRRILQEERFVSDYEAATIFAATQIGLNIHSGQSHQAGLNARSFDLLAAGAFQLMDALPGMEELLEPGREVAVYRTPQEAAERVQYYLKHPEERAAIAARGRTRTLAQHTYLHRMRSLLQAVQS